jgi:hypothetical protein
LLNLNDLVAPAEQMAGQCGLSSLGLTGIEQWMVKLARYR